MVDVTQEDRAFFIRNSVLSLVEQGRVETGEADSNPFMQDIARHRTTALAAKEAELAEMTRRRDEWRKKAEGFDAIRHALREKVGSPWPPSLSRALWAALAADEKKRADDAESELVAERATVERLREALENVLDGIATGTLRTCGAVEEARATLAETQP